MYQLLKGVHPFMRVKLKEELLKMRFEDVYDRLHKKELNCEEAADILGMSARTFLRKRRVFERDDFDGSFDKRLGRPSHRRASDVEVEALTKLYNGRYTGFSAKHFYQFARQSPLINRSYNWCRLTLQKEGLLSKGTRGGKHRLRRERKPMAGMMIHQDGSTHRWIESLDYNVDLIVTMDDATSVITSAFFIEQEGTISSFLGIKETIEAHGLFCTFYTDRGSHYAYTPEEGGKVDSSKPTQVGRALKQLGIKHIHAYSPEARGRSERMFGTLQGRLPKELTMMGIKTIAEANSYLKDVFLPRHNKEFSVKAKDPKSAYVGWANQTCLEEILCIKEDRVVQKDNTVRYHSLVLQIPSSEHRHHYVKADVEVRQYLNGTLGIFYGHQCIGCYDQAGNIRVSKDKEHRKAG